MKEASQGSSPQPFLPQPTKVPELDRSPIEEVIEPTEEIPIASAGDISPNEDVTDNPVIYTVSTSLALTVPKEEVID